MSERTRALEDKAVAAFRSAVRRVHDGFAPGEADHDFYGALLEALVAKFNDNLTNELASIRRLTDAMPGESTYKAVKRLRDNGRAVLAKYRTAQETWKRLDSLRDKVTIGAYEALLDQRDAEAASHARGFELGVRAAVWWLRQHAFHRPKHSAATLLDAARDIEWEVLEGHAGIGDGGATVDEMTEWFGVWAVYADGREVRCRDGMWRKWNGIGNTSEGPFEGTRDEAVTYAMKLKEANGSDAGTDYSVRPLGRRTARA